VPELLANRQWPRAVVRAGHDLVTAELAAQDLELGLEEPDAGIATCGALSIPNIPSAAFGVPSEDLSWLGAVSNDARIEVEGLRRRVSSA
jgi:hypothetical protein